MICGENLPFCGDDSNKYIGRSTRTWRCVYRLYCQIFVNNETEMLSLCNVYGSSFSIANI